MSPQVAAVPFLLAMASVASVSCGAARPVGAPATGAETLWLDAGGLRLKTRVYRSAKLGPHPRLVIVLHGDSPFGPPSYQYAFARRAAGQLDDVVIAAILRPGYTDDTGERSGGERGRAAGDNYTPRVVDAVARAVAALEARFGAREVLLVGHSGGAAVAANILGRVPGRASAALLVSCPCDLAAWREHMARTQAAPVWSEPVESLSPLDLAPGVAPAAEVHMLVGSRDAIAPPELTQRYAAALQARGVRVTVTVAPELEHDIFLEPITFAQLAALLDSRAGRGVDAH